MERKTCSCIPSEGSACSDCPRDEVTYHFECSTCGYQSRTWTEGADEIEQAHALLDFAYHTDEDEDGAQKQLIKTTRALVAA